MRPPINMTINYTIVDEYFRSQPKLETLGASHPNIQIFKENIRTSYRN